VKQIAQFGMQMVARYRHRRYSGHVHLFYGAHWQPDYVTRWTRLTGAGTTSYLLPGGHIEMMEEPHVREVAARLAEHLPKPSVPPGVIPVGHRSTG
jgi:thioesterase domain-containing protein